MSVRSSLVSGFTLLELLVVLVVMILVAGVVGPRVAGSLTQLQLKTGTKKLAASLRYARSQAATRSVTYVALLNFRERDVTIRGEEESVAEEESPPRPESEDASLLERPMQFRLPEGVRFDRAVSGDEEWNAGTFLMTFYPDGRSSGGRVVLADERDRKYSVDVDFITGAVRVREGGPS